MIPEKYTYDDYKNWEGDWELIEGYPLAMAPAPMIRHQKLSVFITRAFLNSIEMCEECDVLSEVDYKISEDTVVRPDVVLTCGEKNEYYLTKAPQIIVEIISKATAKRDEKVKFALYEREKVTYYILVYPDDLRAKIYKLKNGKYEKEGDFLTQKYRFRDIECEFEVDFNDIFKRLRK